MNARQAVEANNQMVINLVELAKRNAARSGKTISEAIDSIVALYIEEATTNNAKCAWDIRGDEAKKMIALENQDLQVGQEIAKSTNRFNSEFFIGEVKEIKGDKALIYFTSRYLSRWCNLSNLEVVTKS